MNKPLCFVVMGFGQKKDPETNRTIDLDQTYIKIIRPAVEACNYRCVRADEILESGIIDRSMYALLYRAELVIADISTFNPNAIYELGIRHAMKPFSTIIIREDQCKIPFDINHNRILLYSHLGNEISNTEAKECITKLKSIINSVSSNPVVDSPLYTYIPRLQKPQLSDDDLQEIIKELKQNENTIYALTEKAKDLMIENKFFEASKIWKRLKEKVKNDVYYIQQEALCTYKSKEPNELQALTSALSIISAIDNQVDSETLGITAAIYKNLWIILGTSNGRDYLDMAIKYYKKGWNLYNDYYTGENYANCLEQKRMIEDDTNRAIYYKIEAENTRNELVKIILESLQEEEPEEIKWKYATLSNCYLSLGDKIKSQIYETKFKQQNPYNWEMESFEKTKQGITKYKEAYG